MAKVRSRIDVGRMSAAASRPGIDPRIWGSWAIITELGFDPEQGVFADVQLQPTGETETVYVGTTYAGGGFGTWRPLKVDDTVFLMFPNGDPNNGGVIVARQWNGGDPPPAEFANGETPIEDLVELVEPGKNYKVLVSNGGLVILGNESTADFLAKATPTQQFIDAVKTFAQTSSTATLATQIAAAALTLLGQIQAIQVATGDTKGS